MMVAWSRLPKMSRYIVPATVIRYSDANFVALGEVVRRVSGQNLNVYCAQKIFGPLGMRNTGFLPGPALKNRIAPTDVRWGAVQDPTRLSIGRGGRQCRASSAPPTIWPFCVR